ncbi:MAG: hypothetical protein KDI43_07725 [Gammaproteobacteria bacterium]|nr:hypothetical protein [Gammaproteobacteria bacterium]MCP5406922.1 hypothetical protein [Chromatiaceae bacterium]MCP5408501.1 hypothetical protein [Chromatiaceae bacterium]MCP5444864.1 hypothetical protein [Chromatiaceae bacterium]
MKARFNSFGEIEIDGVCYPHDVVIERGAVRKRKKSASKAYRESYGHTPLSAEESIPWAGNSLYIGTGMYGSLPVMPAVYKEAEKRGIELVVDKTGAICRLLEESQPKEINAILHVTC